MARSLSVVLFLLVGFSSCVFLGGKRVRGNGNVTTREVSVSSFKAVDVSGAIDVIVTQGDQKPVRVEADENLQEYIEVSDRGNKLEIHTKRGYNLKPSRKIRVYLTAPAFTKLEVSGACNIIGEGKISQGDGMELEVSGAGDIKMDVNAPEVTAKLSGSGNVNMSGETRVFKLRISGAGDAGCYDLRSERTDVDISGAGSAEVYASVQLDAQVSGAGSVRYKGNASKVNQQVSGAGSVKQAD